MSYSLVIARRRIEALERRPSALKPMIIRGGMPRDVNRASRTSPCPMRGAGSITESLQPNKSAKS